MRAIKSANEPSDYFTLSGHGGAVQYKDPSLRQESSNFIQRFNVLRKELQWHKTNDITEAYLLCT
jgi:hypothetical protein